MYVFVLYMYACTYVYTHVHVYGNSFQRAFHRSWMFVTLSEIHGSIQLPRVCNQTLGLANLVGEKYYLSVILMSISQSRVSFHWYKSHW